MLSSRFEATVITSDSAWAQLRPEWEDLFAASPNACAPLSYCWLNIWWEIFGPEYGPAPGGLRVLLLRDGDQLIAALPMYMKYGRSAGILSRRVLCFIGTGEAANEAVYPEKLDLLSRKLSSEQENFVRNEVRTYFSRLQWDQFDSGVMVENSNLSRLMSPEDTSGVPVNRQYTGPFADLSSGFDGYLATRSANSRQQFRRLIRDAEKNGYSLKIARGPDEKARALEELVAMHQSRWTRIGERGAFEAERVRRFHSRVVQECPADSVILATLNGPTTEAVLYGFACRGVFDFYQSGVAPTLTARLKSPGITAHVLLMRELAQLGIQRYDLLAGNSSYKEKLATGSYNFIRRRQFKKTLSNVIAMTREIQARLFQSIGRRLTMSERRASQDA